MRAFAAVSVAGDAGGVVSGDRTAHAALGGGWGAAAEERVSATCVTDLFCTNHSRHEPTGYDGVHPPPQAPCTETD